MAISMTGFAARAGALEDWSWSLDIRSVNGRGRDIRLRVPDWIEGLDQAVRSAVTDRVARGSVTVGMRLARTAAGAVPRLDAEALEQGLAQLARVAGVAAEAGVPLAPVSAADVLALPGVQTTAEPETDTRALKAALLGELAAALDEFTASRAAEGAALVAVLSGQLDRIAELRNQAVQLADARRGEQAEALRAALARVLENTDGADPDRVAQELALIAVKSDATEEIDRLGAHIDAARALLAADGPVGRKFDFLTQEFNREANTLCSKAGSAALTAVGLDLKTVIDQMREQVQNLE